MEYKLKNRGYLLIISALVIVIAALVGTLIIGMFTGGVKSTGGVAQSNSALYLANSGLQMTKRDIVVDKIGCYFANGRYVNATIPNMTGQFTVTSCLNKVSAKLSAGITADDTTIPLTLDLTTQTGSHANTLTSALTNTTNAIPLADASLFRVSGTLIIDQEYIAYNGKSGNTLTGVIRGVGGTFPAAHNSGASVQQSFLRPNGIIQIGTEMISYKNISAIDGSLENATRGIAGTTKTTHNLNDDVIQAECILTSTAALPDLTTTEGRRIVKEAIFSTDSNSFLFGNFRPAIVSIGDATLAGTAHIINNEVTRNDPDFAGSTILSSGTATIQGAAYTQFEPTSSETQQQARSTKDNINADVQSNYGDINKSNLFTTLFNKTFDQIIPNITIAPGALFTTTIGTNDIVKVTGDLSITNITKTITPKILIINGNLSVSSNAVDLLIGTATQPAIVIVTGNLALSGGPKNAVTINGVFYTMGNFGFSGGSDTFNVNGFTAVEGTANFSGNTNLTLDTDIIDIIKDSGSVTTTYSGTAYEPKEIFH